MALLESAVVIYLREIMYPGGFSFPLKPIPSDLLLTEILREAATLVMLLCIGLLAGNTFSQRFAWFMYSFAIWDIFYYVFLWVLIGWPESLMVWDILFLIPATWTGPVLSPLMLAMLMIVFALVILMKDDKGYNTRIQVLEWTGLIVGSVIEIYAFLAEYMKYMFERFSLLELIKAPGDQLAEYAMEFVPQSFPWVLFAVGWLLILAVIAVYHVRTRKSKPD